MFTKIMIIGLEMTKEGKGLTNDKIDSDVAVISM